MAQSFKGPKDLDATFSALMQVGKATKARVNDSDKSRAELPPDMRDIDIFIPVVVVDGALVEAALDQANKIVVTKVPRQVLLWRNPLVGRPLTVVHVVTRSDLAAFVDDAKRSIQTVLKWAVEHKESVSEIFAIEAKIMKAELRASRRPDSA
jgi:hypothetical protein